MQLNSWIELDMSLISQNWNTTEAMRCVGGGGGNPGSVLCYSGMKHALQMGRDTGVVDII